MKQTSKLMSNAFLLGIGAPARREMQDQAVERAFSRGEPLFKAGDPAECFYLICGGRIVEIYPEARFPPIVLGEGEVLGVSSLAPPYRRLTTAVASTQVDVLVFSGRTARLLSEGDHDFGFALYQRVFGLMMDRLGRASLGGQSDR